MIKKILGLGLILSMSACVSSSKHTKLEKDHAATQEELKNTQLVKQDLEKRLGMSTTQKTELQKALADMNERKKETEKRIAEYQNLTKKFQRLVDAGKLSVNVVGGRMVVALQTDILFTSGSAKLSPQGIVAIKEVSPLLGSLQERSFQIEGHTDNVPIKSASFASNWELASARASNVLKAMLDAGMPAERISAASFAETRPVAPNDTEENRKLNRRIDIVVVPDLSALPGYEELNKMGSAEIYGNK